MQCRATRSDDRFPIATERSNRALENGQLLPLRQSVVHMIPCEFARRIVATTLPLVRGRRQIRYNEIGRTF